MVTVKNLTPETLPPIGIRIKVTNTNENVFTQSRALGPNEIHTAGLLAWRGNRRGTWSFTAEADWENVLAEDFVNSADNHKTETLTLFDDRIEMVDVRVSGPTSVVLRMKNLTDGPLDVPWEIRDGERVVRTSVNASSNPGEFEVPISGITSLQTPGLHLLTGVADPQNRIPEIDLARANNRKTIEYTSTYTPPPRLVERDLEFDKAKAAGAWFNNNPIHVGGCLLFGAFDYQKQQYYDKRGVPCEVDTNNPPAVLFALCCVGSSQGTEAQPAAYGNFILAPEWKIKRVNRVFLKTFNGTWEWMVGPPVVASNNPLMQIRLKLNRGGGYVYVAFQIIIEGPEGTDPYGR